MVLLANIESPRSLSTEDYQILPIPTSPRLLSADSPKNLINPVEKCDESHAKPTRQLASSTVSSPLRFPVAARFSLYPQPYRQWQ